MLRLRHLAELDVSAASGLVALPDALCVIADDETFLALYRHDGTPLRRVALLDHALPEAHAARKREKPDFEALAQLPDGRLFALGSGSTAQRTRAVLIELASAEHPRDRVSVVELAPLYAALQRSLPELNIEGACVWGDALYLAQRGNGASAQNACVELDLARVLQAIASTQTLEPDVVRALRPVELGTLDGVPLGFTDLSAHPSSGLLFSAAAEASASTYDDAPCSGSVVGTLSAAGQVLHQELLSPTCKIEGLAALLGPGGGLELRLVADPDDRGARAPLFSATLK